MVHHIRIQQWRVGAAVLVDELDSSLDGRIDKMEEIGFVLPKFNNLTD